MALAIGIRWDGKRGGADPDAAAQSSPPSRRASTWCGSPPSSATARGGSSQDLTARDFEVLDGGQARNITDFRHDLDRRQRRDAVRRQRQHGRASDERARGGRRTSSAGSTPRATRRRSSRSTRIWTSVAPFTAGLKTLPDVADAAKCPFGATSLHDAIALTARRVGEREGRRRAVVVLTDGADTASHLKPAEVSAIASGIDVPVYIFGIVPSIDNPSEETAVPSVEQSALAGPLADLAAWTGGHVFVASTPGQRSIAARQIIDELRHQYLIAFESSGAAGLASARGPRAQQGPHLFGPGVVTSRGNHARRCIRRIDHVPEILRGCSPRRSGDRRLDRLRHQEVRANQRRRSEREGRRAGPLARGNAGAHAQERRAHLGGRRQGRGGRLRRRRRPTTPRQRRNSAATDAKAVGTEANTKFDAMDKANKRLVYEVVLSEDQGNFKFGKTDAAG